MKDRRPGRPAQRHFWPWRWCSQNCCSSILINIRWHLRECDKGWPQGAAVPEEPSVTPDSWHPCSQISSSVLQQITGFASTSCPVSLAPTSSSSSISWSQHWTSVDSQTLQYRWAEFIWGVMSGQSCDTFYRKAENPQDLDCKFLRFDGMCLFQFPVLWNRMLGTSPFCCTVRVVENQYMHFVFKSFKINKILDYLNTKDFRMGFLVLDPTIVTFSNTSDCLKYCGFLRSSSEGCFFYFNHLFSFFFSFFSSG